MVTSNQVGLARMLMQMCFKNVHSFVSALLRWILMRVSGVLVQPTPLGRMSRPKTRTKEQKKEPSAQLTTPSSVNYHFTRQCNYKCGFCFHTAKTSFVLPIEEAKRGLRLLKEAGNFISKDTMKSPFCFFCFFDIAEFTLNDLSVQIIYLFMYLKICAHNL